MLEVTDMFVTAARLVAPIDPVVEIVEVDSSERGGLLRLVAQEHPPFLQYYQTPGQGTAPCAVRHAGATVGGVLLEREYEGAESDRDAALGALFISSKDRNRGLGSAAIAATARLLLDEGYERVLAEWVWTVAIYERLGFQVWRTRLIDR
jgi:GNAT superfamily N-acetyltransferase